MNKEKYKHTGLKLIRFRTGDVIFTSRINPCSENDEHEMNK